MARLNTNAIVTPLDELVPKYAQDKAELDALKKVCESENNSIKTQMYELGEDVYTAGGYTAKRVVSHREVINEELLIAMLQKHKIEGVIKTKEYVDMDALENYLYNNEPSAELAADLAKCKSDTEVIQLRISKAKE